MTGPALASSGWPTAAIRRASSAIQLGGLRRRRRRTPGGARPRRAPSRRRRSVGPSQATGRVQPRRTPTQAMTCVEGEQRGHDQQDVDRAGAVEEGAPCGRDREDEARDEEEDGPPAAAAAGGRTERHSQGRPTRPISESGRPSSSRTLNRLWSGPHRPHLEQARPGPAPGSARGSAGRSRRRCRSPTRNSAFVAAPGPAADCRRPPSRGAPTARRRAIATTATTPIRRTRTSVGATVANQAMPTQMRASQTASLRVRAAQAQQEPEPDEPRVGQAAAARIAGRSGSSAGTPPRTRAVNGIVESGRAELRSKGR